MLWLWLRTKNSFLSRVAAPDIQLTPHALSHILALFEPNRPPPAPLNTLFLIPFIPMCPFFVCLCSQQWYIFAQNRFEVERGALSYNISDSLSGRHTSATFSDVNYTREKLTDTRSGRMKAVRGCSETQTKENVKRVMCDRVEWAWSG